MNPDNLKQSLASFWSERNKREQNMLVVAIAVVVLGLLYLLLIDPALSGRANLEKQLPALRQQAAEVQALSKEASAVGSKAAAIPQPMTRESIESSLARKGLKPQGVTLSGDLAKVQLNAVAFADTVQWLDDLQKTARISVVEANIDAQEQVGTVNASFILRQQGSEQAR
ncbi:MAG TPA: type II secretion system protein GspM [Noviherbaspirillum sp.]|nr:type II secretion system protein GspM [Noviherbaspirillum sp.]